MKDTEDSREEPSSLGSPRIGRGEIAVLLIAAAFLLVGTIPNLANYPAPTGDEVWILSASYKLATEGVFGTDLFTGFYNADKAYLFNMPLHEIVLAGVFKVLGTSVLIGRLVSVGYGLATIALVYGFARRIYGAPIALIALAFLLLLRLNIGFDTGLPLQELSRSIRYDLAPVPLMLAGSIALLKPTVKRSAIAGGLFSLAMLMQFYGAFMLPVAAAYSLLEKGSRASRLKLVTALVLGALAVAIPYGAYVLANYDDFQGQTSTLYGRTEIGLSFFIDNLRHESRRFPLDLDGFAEAPAHRPSARLAILFGLPAAAAYTAMRAHRFKRRGERLLCLSLLGLPAQLALLDSEKIYFYWIGVFPFLCIGLAALVYDGLRSAILVLKQRRLRPVGLAFGGMALGFLILVLGEGTYAQYKGFGTFDNASDYLGLRQEIGEFVPPGARVVGATELWWAMPETEFRSYYLLFYFTNPRTTENVMTISGYLDSFRTEYIVLNRTSRHFLEGLSNGGRNGLDEYLQDRGREVAYLPDRSYGWIEIWRID